MKKTIKVPATTNWIFNSHDVFESLSPLVEMWKYFCHINEEILFFTEKWPDIKLSSAKGKKIISL